MIANDSLELINARKYEAIFLFFEKHIMNIKYIKCNTAKQRHSVKLK